MLAVAGTIMDGQARSTVLTWCPVETGVTAPQRMRRDATSGSGLRFRAANDPSVFTITT